MFPFGPGEAGRPGRQARRLHGVAGQREPGSGPFAQFGDGVQFRGADHARLVYDDELSGEDEAGLFPGVGFADGAAYPVAFGGGARRGEPAPVFASQVIGLRPVPFGYVSRSLAMVIALVPMLSASSSLARTDRVRPDGSPPCRVSHARATRMVVVFPVPAGPMSALAACGFSSR